MISNEFDFKIVKHIIENLSNFVSFKSFSVSISFTISIENYPCYPNSNEFDFKIVKHIIENLSNFVSFKSFSVSISFTISIENYPCYPNKENFLNFFAYSCNILVFTPLLVRWKDIYKKNLENFLVLGPIWNFSD